VGKVTERDKDALNQLVLDCSIYNFGEKESLDYIKTRFGKAISGRTYRRYKSNIQNGNTTQEWLNYFSSTGFALTQQLLYEGARRLLESSMRRLYEEEKSRKPENENFILRLKQEIREELKVVSEFSLGTPIVLNIKKQRDDAIRKYRELQKNWNESRTIYRNH